MPESIDYAWIEVGGRRLEHWTSYSVDSDLGTPADGFRFTVGLGSSRTDDDRRMRDDLRAILERGAEVRVYVGDPSTEASRALALQMVGVIDDRRTYATEGDGTVIEIEGRDRARHLVDGSVPLDVLRVSTRTAIRVTTEAARPAGNAPPVASRSTSSDPGTAVSPSQLRRVAESYSVVTAPTLAQLARIVCDPFGIPVVCDQLAARDVLTGRPRGTRAQRDALRASSGSSYANGLSPSDVKRIKPEDARPNPGETCWEFLDRHARRLGVFMWMSPTGALILGSPQYGQEPRARIVRRLQSDPADPNNAITGEVNESIGDSYSRVTVYGKSGRNPLTSKIVAVASDGAWPAPFETSLVVHDREITTQAEADRRALRELSKHRAKRLSLKYEVHGHTSTIGGDRHVFGVDTAVDVFDEVAGIRGRFYCVKRTLARSKAGTTTTLVLVEPGSIVV